MLKKIAEIFEKEVKKEIPEFDESQLATTSLMILTAKYDGEFDEIEKAEILRMISDFYSFDKNKIDRIFETALSLTEKANDIHQFTSELNKSLNDDEKLSIIKMLWKIVIADGRIDDYENALIRKISGLLYVDDVQVGQIKKQLI